MSMKMLRCDSAKKSTADFLAVFIVGILLGGSVLFGCSAGRTAPEEAARSVTVISDKAYNFATLRSVAIMPLTASPGVNLSEDDLERFSDALIGFAQNLSELTVINEESRDLSELAKTKLISSPHGVFYNAKLFGLALKAPAVLCGTINTYKSELRGGREYLPGSKVSLTLWLIDATSGRQVWTGSFAQGNEELSNNLISIFNGKNRAHKEAKTLLLQGLEASVKKLAANFTE